MKPMTIAEVAKREKISARRLRMLCQQGRVYYAEKIGPTWIIQPHYHIDRKSVGRPRKPPPRWVKPK